MVSSKTIFYYSWLAVAFGGIGLAGVHFFLGTTGRETATWFGVNVYVLLGIGFFILGLGWLFIFGPYFREFLSETR
jgi:hypothetical protein